MDSKHERVNDVIAGLSKVPVDKQFCLFCKLCKHGHGLIYTNIFWCIGPIERSAPA